MKNFYIKLPVDDVDEIFKNYEIYKIRNAMDYELYLNNLMFGYSSKERQNAINYIFDTISNRGKKPHNVIMGKIISSKKMKKRT